MAILDVYHVKGERSVSWSANGREYQQHIRVITDSPLTGQRAVIKALSLGAGDGSPMLLLGQYYQFPHPVTGDAATEWDYGSFLQSIEGREEGDDGKQWLLTLSYAQYDLRTMAGATTTITWVDGTPVLADGVLNIFEAPPEVKWADAKFQTAVLQDTQTNKTILNTAGDPYDPPLMREETRHVLTVTRNEKTYDIEWISGYKDHVNSDVFLKYDPASDPQAPPDAVAFDGFEKNTVKCASITGDRKYHSDWGWYYEVTYTFEFRPIVWGYTADDVYQLSPVQQSWGFTEMVLNAGLRQKGSDGKPTPVIIAGAPVSTPVCLKEDGTYDSAADPYYQKWDILPRAKFADLKLPGNLLSRVSQRNQQGS